MGKTVLDGLAARLSVRRGAPGATDARLDPVASPTVPSGASRRVSGSVLDVARQEARPAALREKPGSGQSPYGGGTTLCR